MSRDAPTYAVFTRAPVYPSDEQIFALRLLVPELGAVHFHDLELALDLCPVTILAQRQRVEAFELVGQLRAHGLTVDMCPTYGPALVRALLGCDGPEPPFFELTCLPAFHAPSVLRVTQRAEPGSLGMQIAIERGNVYDHLRPITARLAAGLDLEHLPQLDPLREEMVLHDEVGVLARLELLQEQRDPVPGLEQGRDGISIDVRMLDSEGRRVGFERWSPETNEAPRLCGVIHAVIEAGKKATGSSEIGEYLDRLRWYLH